jgi:glycosyltransferase involved in cell wall biosynthesis
MLTSILNQSYKDWTLWIRDDGSTDDTIEKIKAFADSVNIGGAARIKNRVFIMDSTVNGTKKNVGTVRSFSLLSEHILKNKDQPGRYIFFADQDDVWFPDKIKRMVAHADRVMMPLVSESSNASNTPFLLHGDALVVDKYLKLMANSAKTYQSLDCKKDTLMDIVTENTVTGCMMMVNRALLGIALPIPEEAIMHDHWFALFAAATRQLHYHDEPLIYHRQHEANQIGSSTWFDQVLTRMCSPLDIHKNIIRLEHQAAAFEKIYKGNLDFIETESLKTFSHMEEYGIINKRVEAYNHSLRKGGFIKTCAFYIFI